MKHKRIFLSLVLVGLALTQLTLAQNNDKILLTLDGDPVYLSEFTRILDKNSQIEMNSDLEESLRLFINFKLKVKEAQSLGYDTTRQFREELKRNREQIAKPYLLDQNVNDQLLEEAYQRSLQEVRSSHILIAVSPDAPPSDTLRAFQKAMKVKNRLDSGEDFATVAREVSEDPSAQTNGGDLGYYTVFQLVYPFENAIYNTPVGAVTDPVRTQFGYHIIQVTDKRKTRGQLQIGVILKAYNFAMTDQDTLDVQTEIYRIDSLLKSGEDFAELAKKFSDDRSTGNRGGVTRWFGVGTFPSEIEETAFALENIGAVSQPIETDMGWYIIKLLDKKGAPSKEEVLPSLSRSVSRDARSAKSRKEIAKKLKAEYKYSLNKENYEEFYRLVDASIFDGRWDPIVAVNKNGILFTLGDSKVLQKEFGQFLFNNMKTGSATTIAEYVDREFERFTEAKVLEYEDSQLDKKYPEFAALYNEFKEGNLLFEITDKMVWSKAAEDTTGLKSYYEKNKSNYLWDERVDGYVIRLKSKSALNAYADRVYKTVEKNFKKVTDQAELERLITTETKTYQGDSFELILGPFAKGANRLIDNMKWKKDELLKSTEGETVMIAWITSVRKPEPKQLSEAKGQILADYQDYLEKEWVSQLRKKYSVVINEEVLGTIR